MCVCVCVCVRAQNGLALDYTSLPTSVATTVAPFFGIELDAASKARLLQEGDVYSKARKHKGQKFKSDSSAKQKAVTDKTREHVVKYTSEAFQRLQALAGTLTPEPVSSAAAAPGGAGQYSVAESDDSRYCAVGVWTTRWGVTHRVTVRAAVTTLRSSRWVRFWIGGTLTSRTSPRTSTGTTRSPASTTATRFVASLAASTGVRGVLTRLGVTAPAGPGGAVPQRGAALHRVQHPVSGESRGCWATPPSAAHVVVPPPLQEAARRRWTDDYLASQLSRKHGVETSPDNHFMYYNKGAARSQLVSTRVRAL